LVETGDEIDLDMSSGRLVVEVEERGRRKEKEVDRKEGKEGRASKVVVGRRDESDPFALPSILRSLKNRSEGGRSASNLSNTPTFELGCSFNGREGAEEASSPFPSSLAGLPPDSSVLCSLLD